MRTLHIQFWAPFRGTVDVYLNRTNVGLSAEHYAWYAVQRAYALFDAKWPFPGRDRKLMRCLGMEYVQREIA